MRKEIPVIEFSEEKRLQELEKVKAKYEKRGYVFVEYIEKGKANSVAVFEVDEAILKKESKKRNIILGIITIAVLWFIFAPEQSPEEQMQEQSKKTLQETKRLPLEKLEKYSTLYAISKDIDPAYYSKFYSCIGEHLFSKSETLLLEEISQWCERDTKREDYNSMNYVNKASFEPYFSKWDGSYTPFVEYIKSMMNDSNSFEHVKTMHHFVSNTNNPYMQIKCRFKGKNAFGGVVTETWVAKIDDKTKNIYDVSQE